MGEAGGVLLVFQQVNKKNTKDIRLNKNKCENLHPQGLHVSRLPKYKFRTFKIN